MPHVTTRLAFNGKAAEIMSIATGYGNAASLLNTLPVDNVAEEFLIVFS